MLSKCSYFLLHLYMKLKSYLYIRYLNLKDDLRTLDLFEFIRKNFSRFWILGSIYLSLIFYLTSPAISLWPPDLTASGFELFVDVFKIPIYFFVGCMPIYGIILTLERMKQTERQYSILLNNYYYQHKDKFIEEMQGSIDPLTLQNISVRFNRTIESFCREQHKIWYGDINIFHNKLIDKPVNTAMYSFNNIERIINTPKLLNPSSKSNVTCSIKKCFMMLGFEFLGSEISRRGVESIFKDILIVIIFILRYSNKNMQIPSAVFEFIKKQK